MWRRYPLFNGVKDDFNFTAIHSKIPDTIGGPGFFCPLRLRIISRTCSGQYCTSELAINGTSPILLESSTSSKCKYIDSASYRPRVSRSVVVGVGMNCLPYLLDEGIKGCGSYVRVSAMRRADGYGGWRLEIIKVIRHERTIEISSRAGA